MSWRLSAAALSLGLMLACRGTPAPSLPAAPPRTATTSPSVDALRLRVARLLADPNVAAGTWGLEVRSLRTQETLVETNAHRLLTPGSTLKAVTLAVAADRLGWDYTYDTRVVAKGAVANGVLDGDLVVIGSGDPSFDDWDGSASAVFGSWANALKTRGVSAVSGRVVGNHSVFADDGFGAGWMWDDMAYAYSAPASGLQFNEGAAQVSITPGAAVGDPPVLALVPSHARVPVVNNARTGPAGSGTTLTLQALPRTAGATLSGTVALDSRPQLRNVSVGNPALYFANALRTGLLANGVDVFGGAMDSTEPVEVPATEGPLVLTHRSAPLSALADTMMKLSVNLYAETLLRTLGRDQGGDGSASAGIQVVRDALVSWGVPAAEVQIADGSGLSRYNLATPDAIVSVLAHVFADDRLRDPYIASLPVAGVSGTLASRMKGTAAERNAQAKTGSFTNLRAVAGYVHSAEGEPLAFAIIANNYGGAPAPVDHVTDAVVGTLAEFRR